MQSRAIGSARACYKGLSAWATALWLRHATALVIVNTQVESRDGIALFGQRGEEKGIDCTGRICRAGGRNSLGKQYFGCEQNTQQNKF